MPRIKKPKMFGVNALSKLPKKVKIEKMAAKKPKKMGSKKPKVPKMGKMTMGEFMKRRNDGGY